MRDQMTREALEAGLCPVCHSALTVEGSLRWCPAQPLEHRVPQEELTHA